MEVEKRMEVVEEEKRTEAEQLRQAKLTASRLSDRNADLLAESMTLCDTLGPGCHKAPGGSYSSLSIAQPASYQTTP